MIDKHAPYREVRVSEKHCPWISTDLTDLIRYRDNVKETAIKSRSVDLMTAYKSLRNQVTSLNRHLKKQYFSDKIIATEGNVKGTWETINQLLKKGSKATNIKNLNVDGVEVSCNDDIANFMYDYFCSVGKDLAKDVPDIPNPLINGDYTINTDWSSFHFKGTSSAGVENAIGKLKTTKSLGNDKISSFFIKLVLPHICDSLAKMFNVSIIFWKFKGAWKIARVTQIFKNSETAERSNYRPISVLSILSKLFEKLGFDQLYRYLNRNNLLSPSQSGFKTLHSTVSSLLKETDDWYSTLDDSELVDVVFVDLKKAFDTINHSLLCSELKHYGVQKEELQWLNSYLSERKQYCRVNGKDSQVLTIEIGLPQGSCLCPLLFLVYIDDLPNAIRTCSDTMFADDTSLSVHEKTLHQLNMTLNKDFDYLNSWLMGNKLSLNIVKMHSMITSIR